MPELPEVETIVRELRKKIIGLKITDVWSDRDKPFKQAGGLKKFKKEVVGKKISSIARRAKYIVIDIEGDRTIFVHQKISGHLLYGRWKLVRPRRAFGEAGVAGSWQATVTGPLKDDRENQYIRYIFFLNNGYQLAMSDVRRFSKVVLVKDKNLSNLPELRDLGPEPLQINLKEFRGLFYSGQTTIRKRGRIKQVLMDPFFIVGIGNIYSDEILWDAGYHPLSRVENLNDKDLQKIYISVFKILKKAIQYKGDSMDDYRLPSGEKGGYQDIQKAYQQTGKKCAKKDGGTIQRIKVGGRSAHFCSEHQVLK